MKFDLDVDDPFDQNNPSMPNVLLIDADTTGQDNRGGSNVGNDPTDRGPWTLGAQTDAIGVARATFTVSMQPGDNFRAAASLTPDPNNSQLTQPRERFRRRIHRSGAVPAAEVQPSVAWA